jgi:Cd2+/Zn2+-exporting ATPase
MFISLIWIFVGFTSKYAFDNMDVFNFSLMIASVIGVLPILLQTYQALRVKVVSIDLLVTIAVIGAFIIQAYEESAIVTFLFLFGAYLEARTLNKTRSAIKALTDLSPVTAIKQMPDGAFLEVLVEAVNVGDIVLIKTGEAIPVDGIVVSGEAFINEASITGESMPVHKQKGATVFAGTIAENGTIQVETLKVGEDTTFGKIIELVETAQDSKSETEKFIDGFAKWYTPAVLMLAFIVSLFTKDIPLSITILVLGCPGALVIGVPVSNVAGIGNGAKLGVLIKGSEIIQKFSQTDTIVFDKTGTLTIGHPIVTEAHYYKDDEDLINSYVASIEKESDHVLAKAILNYIGDMNTFKVEQTDVIKGQGIKATVNDLEILIGNQAFIFDNDIKIDMPIIDKISELEQSGHSIVVAAINQNLVSLYAIKDAIRKEVKKDIERIHKMGVKNFILLSGDNQGSVDLVAKSLGIKHAYGRMLPEDKAKYIEKLKQDGHIVTFVGDGINDSPSITSADIGIAMGGGTDVAIETSDVVLMSNDLKQLPHALGLAKAIKYNMIQNILIAVGVVILLLTTLIFGRYLNLGLTMSVGMLVHELSILVVILNAMRLLKFKIKSKSFLNKSK